MNVHKTYSKVTIRARRHCLLRKVGMSRKVTMLVSVRHCFVFLSSHSIMLIYTKSTAPVQEFTAVTFLTHRHSLSHDDICSCPLVQNRSTSSQHTAFLPSYVCHPSSHGIDVAFPSNHSRAREQIRQHRRLVGKNSSISHP